MKHPTLFVILLLAASVLAGPNRLFAQVKDDLKAAGSSTVAALKDSARHVGNGITKTGRGIKKVGSVTGQGLKKGTNKMANGTAKGAEKIARKTETTPDKK
jgi:hypothetical protein